MLVFPPKAHKSFDEALCRVVSPEQETRFYLFEKDADPVEVNRFSAWVHGRKPGVTFSSVLPTDFNDSEIWVHVP